MQNIKRKIRKNFTTPSYDFHILTGFIRCTFANIPCLLSTSSKKKKNTKHSSSLSLRRLAADSRLNQNGGIIYKPRALCMGEVAEYEILSLAFLLRLVLHFWGPRRLEECFAFHSSLRPFTTITFAVINFAAVHTDRCNCYAWRRLHLLKPPTYSTGPFDICV